MAPVAPPVDRGNRLAGATEMSKPERILTLLLRILGGVELIALGAVFLPTAWMAETHRQLGLGQLPEGAIVEYLTRSLSAMYALQGAFVLLLSTDVRRYLLLVRWLAVLGAGFGAVMLAIDLYAGMPWYWTAGEGPVVIVMMGVILWTASKLRQPGT